MASRRSPREQSRTHKFLSCDLPEAESPAPRFDLKGHHSDQLVRRVVVLPKNGKIATACLDGHVRVFGAEGGCNALLDIHAHANRIYGLAAVDEHILATVSLEDGKLHTWDAQTGRRIHTLDVGGVCAIAAVGPETLAAGLITGAVIFIRHTRGGQLAEVARPRRVHTGWIRDIAWHEDVMVTASADKSARVWSLRARLPLAVLRGHQHYVMCTAVNSRYIATGSCDRTVRLYANGAEAKFPLISVLHGLHSKQIYAVQFIGPDLLLSGSWDRTMCFTAAPPDPQPIARLKTNSWINDTAITVDGEIAWGGNNGNASVWTPPLAAVDAAKKHALKTFGSVTQPPAASQLEPPPPLQGALVGALAGRITAGEACRTLINASRCSVSIGEWQCGHRLLMLAVRQNEIAGECGLSVNGKIEHDYWFKNLYLPTKRVELGMQDRKEVDECLAEAKRAGVIEGTQAILVAIDAWLDLNEEVTLLRDAQKPMLMALSIVLLEQAKSRAELQRMRRVQNISLLMNAVFSVVPLGGGAAAGAGMTVFEMAPDFFEGILASGVGLLGAATPPLVDRFVRHTAQVIASWKNVPVKAQRSIRAAAAGLGMTWQEFREMIAEANGVLVRNDDARAGQNGLRVIALEEDDNDAGGEKDAGGENGGAEVLESSEGEAAASDMDTGENDWQEVESGAENDCGQGWDAKNGPTKSVKEAGIDAEQDTNLYQSEPEVGGPAKSRNSRMSMATLKSLALNADDIRLLMEKHTSCLLAAAMVKFDERRAEQCAVFERGIFRAFQRNFVDGEALTEFLDADEAFRIARSGMNEDGEYLSLEVDARKVLEGRLKAFLVKMPRIAS